MNRLGITEQVVAIGDRVDPDIQQCAAGGFGHAHAGGFRHQQSGKGVVHLHPLHVAGFAALHPPPDGPRHVGKPRPHRLAKIDAVFLCRPDHRVRFGGADADRLFAKHRFAQPDRLQGISAVGGVRRCDIHAVHVGGRHRLFGRGTGCRAVFCGKGLCRFGVARIDRRDLVVAFGDAFCGVAGNIAAADIGPAKRVHTPSSFGCGSVDTIRLFCRRVNRNGGFSALCFSKAKGRIAPSFFDYPLLLPPASAKPRSNACSHSCGKTVSWRRNSRSFPYYP